MTAHAQEPDFIFQRNGRFHLNRQGASVQSTTGSRGVRISGSNAGYTMFRGSVKGTGYPLHSPVSPSFPLPASSCAITFQFESTLLYPHLIFYRPLPPFFPDQQHVYVAIVHDFPIYYTVSCETFNSCLEISFTYARKSSGPNTLPCGNPDVTLTSSDKYLPALTFCERPKGIPTVSKRRTMQVRLS